MLQIATDRGPLDLPPDVELSIDETNVLWCDECSYSLPVKAAYTQRNLALLGHPERWEHATQEVNLPCTVSHLRFRKRGLIQLVSFSREDRTLEFSLLLDEGVWFAWAKKAKLADAIAWPEPTTVTWDTSGTEAEVFARKREALDRLTERAWPATSTPHLPTFLQAELTDCAFLSAIKEWEQGAGYTENMWGISGNPDTYHLAKYDIVNKYGLAVGAATPLLFVRTVLKYLFQGWTVHGNPFTSDREAEDGPRGDLLRAFLFNDRITYFESGSRIDYAQLVPDATVAELIALCEGISGTRLVVDPLARVATFVSLGERLRDRPLPIATPLPVSMREVEVRQFALKVGVASCDYARTHEGCTEELLASGRVKAYNTVNWQHQLLRDRGDAGRPWETVPEYPEQLVFDRATQCFGVERWVRKENDRWTFNRTLLSHRLYPRTYGQGEAQYELSVEGVAMSAVAAFSRFFLDAQGNELSLETKYALHLPFYPCRYEGSNDYMHDFEKLAFNQQEATGKLAVSIQRGLHRVYHHPNLYDVMIRQDGSRDDFRPWGGKEAAYTDNRQHYKFAASDIYDIEGQPATAGRNEDYWVSVRGRLVRSERMLALRAAGENGLFETFYQEFARFIANQVPAEVAEPSDELNRAPLHAKLRINGQDFVITKRKHVLTLHAHRIASTELAAVVM